MARSIAVFNAGSSSIKVALYRERDGDGALERAARAQIDRLDGTPRLRVGAADGDAWTDVAWEGAGDAAATTRLLQWLQQSGDGALAAIGHRVVHGGDAFVQPVRVSPAILAALDALTPLAPLHQPANLAPICTLLAQAPDLPQVACFDTAFHHGAPAVEKAFALPAAIVDAGVHRYGFHGLSYEYIAQHLLAMAPAVAQGRVIVAHLGNGASMCAMHDGRSVATTMGFTALDGLVMGTRSGEVDPGVVLYLAQSLHMDARAIEDLLYRRAGLLGVSGISGDMRTLLASPDPRAAFAVELFCYRAMRAIGSLAAALGGVDALVFTGGIGEHAQPVRARIVAQARWLGFALDDAANERSAARIGSPGSKPVFVIPTDEEAVIAAHVRGIIGG
jgi:acetate kinase